MDVNATSAETVVNVKQNDAFARFINVTLTEDGAKYTPETGVWAMFRCEKPDGKGVMTDSQYADEELGRFLVKIENDGTVTIELVPQVTTVLGRCKCDVCLMFNEETLSTTPFVINVLPSPNIASLAVSSDDFRTLVNLINEVEGLEDKVLDKIATLTLPNNWSGNGPYTQVVTVTGYLVSPRTKVDLVCDETAINIMTDSGTNIIYIVNDNGTLTAYAIGEKPNASITVQAVISETRVI